MSPETRTLPQATMDASGADKFRILTADKVEPRRGFKEKARTISWV